MRSWWYSKGLVGEIRIPMILRGGGGGCCVCSRSLKPAINPARVLPLPQATKM